MRRVILESPYAGEVERNTIYARRALRDSLLKDEAPIASHLLHTQVLYDYLNEEREMGIGAGIAWIPYAEYMVCYIDYGVSIGMMRAIELASINKVRVEFRKIGENP